MNEPTDASRGQRLALALVVLLGLGVRLVPWGMTMTREGVRFRSDTDPYYHALRAQRALSDWPSVPWSDAQMNFPYGAQIPWPPLFDFAIAAASKAAGATAADPERVARVAAFLALLIGVALLPLVALLGKRLLGGGLWVDAALLVALLPANIRYGAVGAADQHGAELLLSCGIFLGFVSSFRGAPGAPAHRWRGPVLLGLLLAAAFWNWLGSALYLLVLVGVTGLWRIVAPEADAASRAMARALLLGGGMAALLLACSIALWAPPGSLGQGGLNGLTGLHAAMCATAATFGLLLLAADSMPGSRTRAGRLLQVAAACALSLLPLLALPAFRTGIAHGLIALSRANPWYDSIAEYQPILRSGMRSLSGDVADVVAALGLGLFAMPFAAIALRRRWKRGSEERPAVFFLSVWGAAFYLLTLKAARFQLYLVVPMALWTCTAFREVAFAPSGLVTGGTSWLRRSIPFMGALLVASPALGNVKEANYARQQHGFESDLIPSLQWLRVAAPIDPTRPAVMAEWAVGHLVQYFAGKPVVATPFGTEALEPGPGPSPHAGSMEDWAAFLFATNAEDAESVLARRRAGFLLLRSPKNEVLYATGFAPANTPAAGDVSFDWLTGPLPSLREDFGRLVASRLYYFDGVSASATVETLGGFRLLYESPLVERVPNLPPTHLYKIFGVVRGARIAVVGGTSGSVLTARARIMTNQGRVLEWTTRAPLDRDGRGELRLPYATGTNGQVRAGPYRLSDGVHAGTLELDEKDVASGSMAIDLSR